MQLEITALSYGKGPRVTAGLDGRDGPSSLSPPSQKEQDSMARFWAMEEANTPKGWEDEMELDYEEIAKKSAMNRRHLVDSKNSGNMLFYVEMVRGPTSYTFLFVRTSIISRNLF